MRAHKTITDARCLPGGNCQCRCVSSCTAVFSLNDLHFSSAAFLHRSGWNRQTSSSSSLVFVFAQVVSNYVTSSARTWRSTSVCWSLSPLANASSWSEGCAVTKSERTTRERGASRGSKLEPKFELQPLFARGTVSASDLLMFYRTPSYIIMTKKVCMCVWSSWGQLNGSTYATTSQIFLKFCFK